MSLKQKKLQYLADNKMLKDKPKKEPNSSKFMFTDKDNKEVLLGNLIAEKDDETGFTNYSAQISVDDGKTWNTTEIGYMPKALKTRLVNMNLKEDSVVLIKYKGKKESPNCKGRFFHSFYVEQIE